MYILDVEYEYVRFTYVQCAFEADHVQCGARWYRVKQGPLLLLDQRAHLPHLSSSNLFISLADLFAHYLI